MAMMSWYGRLVIFVRVGMKVHVVIWMGCGRGIWRSWDNFQRSYGEHVIMSDMCWGVKIQG